MCGASVTPEGAPLNRCPVVAPELDQFASGVLRVFDASQDQYEWASGMSSYRVGIPVDRLLSIARLLGYHPEDLFMEKLRVCVRTVVNYDISRLPNLPTAEG